MRTNKADVQDNEFEIQQELTSLSQALAKDDNAKIGECWARLELLLTQLVDQRRMQFRRNP